MPRKLDSDSQIGRRLRLRDLHLFFTVVQHGSMAKAASQLGISQPNVSEVIADLEHTLGARLFDRRPRGVEPTMYGNALLTRTRAVFDELRQGIKDIEFLADPTGGEVRIGCSVAASVTFLRPIIYGFSEAFPGVVLRVVDVPTAAWELGLRERKHDLLLQWCVTPFLGSLCSEVNVESLFDDPLVVVAGPQTRWARRRKIDLGELVGERWILGPPGTANYQALRRPSGPVALPCRRSFWRPSRCRFEPTFSSPASSSRPCRGRSHSSRRSKYCLSSYQFGHGGSRYLR